MRSNNAAELVSRIGVTLLVQRDQRETGGGSDHNPYFGEVDERVLEKMLRDANLPMMERYGSEDQIVGGLVHKSKVDAEAQRWLAGLGAGSLGAVLHPVNRAAGRCEVVNTIPIRTPCHAEPILINP